MTFSITRGSKAPELAGVTNGESYEAVGFTDGNVVIINDDGQPTLVGYKAISDDGEWSVASEAKPKKNAKK